MVDGEGSAKSRARRVLWWSSAAAGATVVVTFSSSARPGALAFRSLMGHWSRVTRPSSGPAPDVVAIADQQYDPRVPDSRLDAYFPSDVAAGRGLPTVIWIHGGAWIAGAKHAAAHYFEMLARAGFSVIAVEYSRAPDVLYPTPIVQINDAIAFVQRHAATFHVDTEQIVVAGDSAGAQMASQIATLVTDPAYATQIGIVPSLRPEQLRAAILFCGVYDASSAARHPRRLPNAALQLFSRNVLWAYTGSRERDSAPLRQMSTIDHVTSAFPPAFISGGNADPFTDAHSRPFAARLADLGVDVVTHFFAPDHTPARGHLYQFRTETPDAQAAFDAVVDFIERRVDTTRRSRASGPAATPAMPA